MTLEVWIEALGIFCLRLADVAAGTLRISMLVRGYRLVAGAVSFIESLLWLVATTKALTGLDEPLKFMAFAGGYGAGTMLGATIDRWLALGSCVLRVIAPVGSPQSAEALHRLGIDVTVINATGQSGEMRLTFGVIPKRRQQQILKVISEINPDALVSIDAVTTADLRQHAFSRQGVHWLSRIRP